MTDANPLNGSRHNASCYEPCGRRTDAPWFCVWTKPQQERLAEISLQSEGFPSYFPMHLATLPNRTTRIEHLFPRYGFIQPNPAGQWVPALYAKGVTALIRTPSGAPRRVPEPILAALWLQCAPNGVIYPAEAPNVLPGASVRVTSGALSEMTGICSRTAKDRIWVLMSILGRQTEVGFPMAAVEAV